MEKVSANDAMRAYLIAEHFRRNIQHNNLFENDLLKELDYSVECFRDADTAFLKKTVAKIGDRHRLERFLKHRWFMQNIQLKYVGAWPGAGDLPREWTQNSVVYTASQIESDKMLTKSKSVKWINLLRINIMKIIEKIPPVLVSGSIAFSAFEGQP